MEKVTGPRPEGRRRVMLRQSGTCFSAADQRRSIPASVGVASSRRSGPRWLAVGGSFPVRRKIRSFAHGYDITAPLKTITASGAAHQIPITLCQLKSRARPETAARKNAMALTLRADHRRGIQRNGPET